MVGNYNFGPSSPDIKLLSYMASVGAMSHAPFLAAPAPEFFNLNSFEELPNLKEIKTSSPALGMPSGALFVKAKTPATSP